jgi:hypothetical protein
VAWKPRTEGGGEGRASAACTSWTTRWSCRQLKGIDKFERGDDGKLVLPRTPDGEFQLIETVYFHGVQASHGQE